ncbi:MAG: hypothetical protein K8S25_03585 [Alphaproteobacteria bacterium]|nr:hypothetical protein [Alphaproteobacteria bacterium]
MRPVALAGILASTTMLCGCAATVGGISLSSISSFAGFASTLFTGADLGEHAASLVTGKDCRFSEGLMREDRDICEAPGSAATRDDFHGIFVERIDPDGTVIYAAPKYMSASVGAGENENDPDVIWAQIKVQKAQEESERQLARANATQSIDVAALATGSLSSQSLAFMPVSTTVASEFTDGETASQTAQQPRAIANAAKPVATPVPVQAPAAEVSFDTSQPAIDEKSFTAPMQASVSTANGQGGPFIATAASSTPVASTLINGEPVVILRIGPMFATAAQSSAEATSAVSTTSEPAGEIPAMFSTLPSTPAAAPSPLAVLSLQTPARAALPTEVAFVEPQMTAARPRTKPDAVEPAVEIAKPKPARVTRPRAVEVQAQQDVYQPPARSAAAYDPEGDVSAPTPVQIPGDIPAEHMALPVTETPASAAPSESPSPATSGPAPLVPMPQP